jgi:Ca2+-binding EF-hand superfamily protein
MTDPISTNKIAEYIMKDYDKNKDGFIDLKTERVSKIEEGKYTSYNTRDHLFKVADVNNDGKVSQQDILAVIDLFDENHDGDLDSESSFLDTVKSSIGITPDKKSELQNFSINYPENRKLR